MDIKQKSIGVLIDELITTSMKCWFAQERLLAGKTDKETADAARDCQALNARRNNLMRAIDEVLGQGSISLTKKTYDK